MSTLLLTRSAVARLLSLPDCIAAVERAFALHGSGQAAPPAVAAVHVTDGGFHIKAGVLAVNGREYFAAKTNGNFPANRARHQLPTIQGSITLCDATNGAPLALMDSIEITVLRTAAATAVAAKYLAPHGATRAAIIGCGVQGRAQLRALMHVCQLREVAAYDVVSTAAAAFANELSAELGLAVIATSSIAQAAAAAQIIVTCTTSRRAFLAPEHVATGSFIAAVGADNEDKQELEPALMAGAHVVTDVTAQCAAFGDLHHAIAAGALTANQVHAELGQIVCGKRSGRTSADETFIFDSTGMALQDVGAAAVVYEAAQRSGNERTVELSA